MDMDGHPLSAEVERLASLAGCTADDLLSQAAGTTPATTVQARALRAGWTSADLDTQPEPDDSENQEPQP